MGNLQQQKQGTESIVNDDKNNGVHKLVVHKFVNSMLFVNFAPKSKQYVNANGVQNYSSYVQQLAWNVMAETQHEADESCLQNGIEALLAQCDNLFVQQTENLTTYQLNFIRLLCNGVHSGFTSQEVSSDYPLGTKSNIDRIKRALQDRELITIEKKGAYLADSVFELWFKREMM